MIVIDKWPGLVTNASPYAIPPGAAVTQQNLQVLNPGQVTVRPGSAALTFTSLTAGTTAIRSAIRAVASGGILYQDASGAIRAGGGAG